MFCTYLFLLITVIFGLYLNPISACPVSVAAICKCQLWLRGLRLDCSHLNFTEIVTTLRTADVAISKLIVHHSQIPVLTAAALKSLKIEDLDLSNSNISEIEGDAFHNLTEQLVSLTLVNNSLGTYPNISGLAKLESLDLSGNRLTTIPEKFFVDNPRLNQLRLERNNICTLPSGALDETKLSLRLLDLSDNCLASVPAQNLRGSQKLQYLDLSGNQIPELLNLQFMNLPELKEVRLNGNRIAKVWPLSFMNVPKLQQLYLRDNAIEQLDVNRFQAFEQLEVLDLSHNRLRKVPNSAFKEIPKLRQLLLDHNEIDSIETLAFSANPNLELITIQNNHLKSLFRNAFDSLPKMTMLYLANNDMDTIGRGIFTGMRNLQQLNLHNNQLMSIDPLAFEAVPRLTTLDLGENRLKDVPVETFNGLDRLFWLDLCCNRISSFEKGTFKHKVDNLILHGNPLECNKSLDWFIEYLVKNNIRTFLPDQKEVTCTGPEEFAGTRLKEIMIKKANQTFFNTMNNLIPGGTKSGGSGARFPLQNLLPSLRTLPGMGDIAGINSPIPGLNTLVRGFPELSQIPGLNVITDPSVSGGRGEEQLLDVLHDFTTPLARFATGDNPQASDVNDLVGSIPRLVNTLPSIPGYPGVDLKSVPPELIQHVMAGGSIPGVPQGILDSMVKKYLTQMAQAAQAANAGRTTTPSGLDVSKVLPPVTALPSDVMQRVIQGENLPYLTTEQTHEIKQHYTKEVIRVQNTAKTNLVDQPKLITGTPAPDTDAILKELAKELDLTQLPPELLQDVASGQPLDFAKIPKEIIEQLRLKKPDLVAQLESNLLPADTKKTPQDIIGSLPPTELPPYYQVIPPYDLGAVDRNTDIKNTPTAKNNSQVPLYTGIGLACVGAVTMITVIYLCYRLRKKMTARQEIDRTKFFHHSSSPNSFDSLNIASTGNNNNNLTPVHSGTGSFYDMPTQPTYDLPYARQTAAPNPSWMFGGQEYRRTEM